MYEEYEAVLLKDGRYASIDDKSGPGSYVATVGSSPKDWNIVYISDEDIERKLTEEELEQWSKVSKQRLTEMGL